MNAARLKAERLIYSVMDALDESGDNTEFWKEQFAGMSDAQFKNYISNDFPFYFQTGAFKEPSMDQIVKALDILNVPLLEELYMPYKYKDSNGRPLKSKECLVVYLPIKRMKQMLTKKNGMSISTKTRDMKTGLLTGVDKNGKESDREFESLATMGLDYTMDEFARPKADSLEAMAQMSNAILTKGYVEDSDITVANNDSIGKNLFNCYLIGAHIHSNLIDVDYMTPLTAKNKKKH